MNKSIAVSKDLDKIIKDIAGVARILWEQGWADSNAGNISFNVTEHVPEDIRELNRFPIGEIDKGYPELSGYSFFITGAGTRMRDMARQPSENACILRIAEKSNRYHCIWGKSSESGFKPTSEIHCHLSIHRFLLEKKTAQKVIIHAHPEELTALTLIKEYRKESKLNRLLWSMNPAAKIIIQKGVGLVPYFVPGSDELARATLKAIKKHDVILWEKHGCLAIGADVLETFDQVDILNKAARTFFACKSAGIDPEGLSDAQLAEIGRLFSRKK
ncbi:MAG: rhamnulose-1-phosphate aldolase [Candidatus Aminicenantes bacterium]|nr:rhamnulose-1-phosphate aldolase [Candidatus Aminicenantes bacterium]